MRTLVLRKSVGPFSAGTRVTLVPFNSRPEIGLAVVKAKYYKQTKYEGNLRMVEVVEEFEIGVDYLVELRSATSEAPAVPRINRPDRVARRILWKKLNGIEGVI